MGNPVMGEVGFTVDDKTYTFKLGTYAQAVLERKTKVTTQKFFARPEDAWGADDLLLVFYAGLHQRHKLTEEQVGDLIDKIGAMRASEIMLEAVTLANRGDGQAAANPQTAEASPA